MPDYNAESHDKTEKASSKVHSKEYLQQDLGSHRANMTTRSDHTKVNDTSTDVAVSGANLSSVSDERKPSPRVPNRKGYKKPRDMPRRPLSAYNLFFREQREVITREREEAKRGGPNNKVMDRQEDIPAQTGKIISQRWKSISPEHLARLKALADVELKAYHESMKEYKRHKTMHEIDHNTQESDTRRDVSFEGGRTKIDAMSASAYARANDGTVSLASHQLGAGVATLEAQKLPSSSFGNESGTDRPDKYCRYPISTLVRSINSNKEKNATLPVDKVFDINNRSFSNTDPDKMLFAQQNVQHQVQNLWDFQSDHLRNVAPTISDTVSQLTQTNDVSSHIYLDCDSRRQLSLAHGQQNVIDDSISTQLIYALQQQRLQQYHQQQQQDSVLAYSNQQLLQNLQQQQQIQLLHQQATYNAILYEQLSQKSQADYFQNLQGLEQRQQLFDGNTLGMWSNQNIPMMPSLGTVNLPPLQLQGFGNNITPASYMNYQTIVNSENDRKRRYESIASQNVADEGRRLIDRSDIDLKGPKDESSTDVENKDNK